MKIFGIEPGADVASGLIFWVSRVEPLRALRCRRRRPMEIPPVRYARSGDVSIACQVTGEGNPIDLVFAPGTVSHLALAWDRPLARMQIERLSRFARLIRHGPRSHRGVRPDIRGPGDPRAARGAGSAPGLAPVSLVVRVTDAE